MVAIYAVFCCGLLGIVGCRQDEPTVPHREAVAQTEPVVNTGDAAASPWAGAAADPSVAAPPEMRPSFRPPDERPRYDASKLAKSGIHEYRSQRLILYTDIEGEIAESLPPLIDQAFVAWEDYFGPLPPARDSSEYQLTGYLMRDQNLFRQAGLLPAALPEFAHGKHDAQQFWMNDSKYDYFRRHLMIHEATHCFMQAMGGTTRDVPVWYLEGMAELFATHFVDDAVVATFAVMPDEMDNFIGFGRIPTIQRAIADGRLLSLDQIGQLQPADFVATNESYAWAWALCMFLDKHPRYHDLLQSLSREYVGEGFATTNHRIFEPLIADLAAEWELFARHLCYGFDVERAAIEFKPGRPFLEASDDFPTTTAAAGRGWQSSGIRVESDVTYDVRAAGRTVLARAPQPWESEAQGISIRYSEGRPIGRLQGLVISEPDAETNRRAVSQVIELGEEGTFVAPFAGTLYLRVNDFWNELSDNSGEYSVTVRVSPGDI